MSKPNATTPGGALSGIVFFLASCVALPVVFLSVGEANYEPAAVVLILMILVYAGSHLTALIARGQKHPMQGIFWLFVYITMGVAALAQATTGLSQRVADPSTLIPAYSIVLTGLVAYDIGRLIAGRKQVDKEGEFAAHPPRTEVRVARVRIVSIVALAVSGYNIASNGIGVYFSSRQETVAALDLAAGASEGQALRALISAMGSVPQLVGLLCWVVIAATQRRTAGKVTMEANVWIFLLGTVLLLTNNVFSASRFWVLTIAVSVFFAIPWAKAAWYRIALAGGAVAAIAAFPLLDVFRLSVEYRASYGFQSRGVIENLAVKDYDQMVMTANGVWYTDAVGFHYGLQMLGNLLFWVPRSIWDGKPLDTGVEIGTAMQQVNVNLSSPLWIELFIDLGLPAVIVGFAMLGFFSRRADGFFSLANGGYFGTPSAMLVLVPLIAGYQFILLRGPLLQSMGRLAVMLLLVWFIFAKVRRSPLTRGVRRLELAVAE